MKLKPLFIASLLILFTFAFIQEPLIAGAKNHPPGQFQLFESPASLTNNAGISAEITLATLNPASTEKINLAGQDCKGVNVLKDVDKVLIDRYGSPPIGRTSLECMSVYENDIYAAKSEYIHNIRYPLRN